MSVATSAVARPSLKSFSACSRSAWVRSLWMAVAVMPSRSSSRASLLQSFFHAQEHQHLSHIARANQIGEQGALAFLRNLVHLVRHQIGGRVAARDFDGERVAQHLISEALDFVGKRRREQQALALRWNQRNDAFQVGQKTHVEHAVGLVEDEDLHLAEVHSLLLHVVKQAAGGGDEDFHASHQRLGLRLHVHAAIHHGRAQRQVFAVTLHRFMHLGGEFACRCEYQCAHRVARG